MTISGAAVAYSTIGGIVLYSGIKGSTISDTVKAVLSGSLNVQGTETINTSVGGSTGSTTGSSSSAPAGTLTQNGTTIYKYLRSNGWTPIQAAGGTCSMWGESSWNPESYALDTNGLYSGGIMQWNGSNYPNYVGQPKPTGNATADLDAQLPAIIKYTNARAGGPGALALMNGTKSILSASQIFSSQIEGAAISDAHSTGASLTLQIVNQVDPGSGLTT